MVYLIYLLLIYLLTIGVIFKPNIYPQVDLTLVFVVQKEYCLLYSQEYSPNLNFFLSFSIQKQSSGYLGKLELKKEKSNCLILLNFSNFVRGTTLLSYVLLF